MTKTTKRRFAANESQVSEFETLHSKIEGLYTEALSLSKKSPADPFNKFKLGITNSVLVATNGFLANVKTALPIDGFEKFDDVQLPGNSDVVFVLSQYLQMLEKLRCDSIEMSHGNWYWTVNGERSSLRTAPPRKLR